MIPTVHEGPHVRKMEKKGIRTEKGELNRWIKATNRMIRELQATIAALKEWFKDAKEILKEPQEVYLLNLLRDYLDMRNKVAMTYAKGKQKAKTGNLKRFAEECNYLKAHELFTLTDFENYLSSVSNKMDEKKETMDKLQASMKELRNLIDLSETYNDLKPVADELKKDKYRFTKAKENYKTEHESELRRFYMVKRKLKEKGFEKEPFPLKAWKSELAELTAENQAEYEQYKLMKADVMMLHQIKGDVDKVMREMHPEIVQPDKSKEKEATL